ncbi:MAG TPA: IPT/TIG domain-containing protein [Polyangia bacterium]|nr:IPT/TIG domain-containing protein [Polyangia bacterium]
MKRVLGLAVSVVLLSLASACQQSGGPLKVDSVEPSQGTTAGGDEITIIGGGFQPGKTQAEVRLGRKRVESVIIASADKIKIVTPANDKGPVDVSVTFDDGTAFKVPNAFRYVEPAANDNARKAFFGGNQNAAGAKIEIEKKAQ